MLRISSMRVTPQWSFRSVADLHQVHLAVDVACGPAGLS